MSLPPPQPSDGSSRLQRMVAVALLAGRVLIRLFRGRWYSKEVMEHLITAGPGALDAIVVINFFAGMIFTIQTARELTRFGLLETAGGVFALAFCREMSPVLTASVLAGKVGSAFAAELGAMRVSDQIDALQMLKTHPIDYLVIPRVVACCAMLPVLSIFATVVGLLGGTTIAGILYGQSPRLFLASVRLALEFRDLQAILIKSVIFGAIVALIGCSWGLTTTGGARGVGESATAAVVSTWIAVFIVDFFLSLALFGAVAL